MEIPKPLEGLTYRMTDRGDASLVNDFFNEVFGDTRSVEACVWKFYTPNQELALLVSIAVDTETGDTVSIYPGVTKRLRVDGKDTQIAHICDTAIRPDYRRGIALYRNFALWHHSYAPPAGILMGYGGRIEKGNYKVGKRILGYADLLQLTTHELRLSLRLAVAHRGGSAMGRLVAALTKPWYRMRFRGAKGPIAVRLVGGFDERYDRLWERVRDQYRVMLIRDRRHLHWRFVENPSGPFRIYEATERGELVGYAVSRLWTHAQAEVSTIIDMVDGKRPAVAEALIAQAAADAARLGKDFLRFAPCPGSTAHEVVAASRHFRPSREEIDHVVFKPLLSDANEIADFGIAELYEVCGNGSNWYYCQADSDFED